MHDNPFQRRQEGPCEASGSSTSYAAHLTPEARRRTAAVRAAGIRRALLKAGVIASTPGGADRARQDHLERHLDGKGYPTFRTDERGRRAATNHRLAWDPMATFGGAER